MPASMSRVSRRILPKFEALDLVLDGFRGLLVFVSVVHGFVLVVGSRTGRATAAAGSGGC